MNVDALALPHMAHGRGVCLPAKLNVRESPNTTAKVLAQLVAGQPVTIWAQDAGWLIVQTVDGLTGWAAAQYIQIEGALIA